MKNEEDLNMLNYRFNMIGLSADWIYQSWLIKGNPTQGLVIFENEDSSTYEIIEFYHDDEKRIENVIHSGSLEKIIALLHNLI